MTQHTPHIYALGSFHFARRARLATISTLSYCCGTCFLKTVENMIEFRLKAREMLELFLV